MAKAIGMEMRAAVKKAAVWGEAAACGAGDGVLVLPHTLKKERTTLKDDSLGICFAEEADRGAVKVEGELPMYLRYDGLDLLLALAMGATGGAPVRQGTTDAYAQTLALADSLDGLFATFAVDNGVNVDEHPGVKLSGLTISGEVGRPVEVRFRAIANGRVVDSTVNTALTMAGASCFESANRVLFSQGAFRMNGRNEAALGAGDTIYPSKFTLTLARKLRGAVGIGSSREEIDEPTNDGQPEVALSLEFPRYTSTSHFAAWDLDTPLKCDIAFTGAEIEAPYNREFRISLPHLRYSGVELPVERGILRHPLTLDCLGAATAPAGMSGITKPFSIALVNRMSTDVLA